MNNFHKKNLAPNSEREALRQARGVLPNLVCFLRVASEETDPTSEIELFVSGVNRFRKSAILNREIFSRRNLIPLLETQIGEEDPMIFIRLLHLISQHLQLSFDNLWRVRIPENFQELVPCPLPVLTGGQFREVSF